MWRVKQGAVLFQTGFFVEAKQVANRAGKNGPLVIDSFVPEAQRRLVQELVYQGTRKMVDMF